MNIQPIGERIILEPKKQEEKTAGGIYIPQTEKDEKKEGIVIAVGTKQDGTALPLKIGDHIIYSGYSATEIEVDAKDYIIVDFKDIVAKIGGK